jgi:hypothetical protein
LVVHEGKNNMRRQMVLGKDCVYSKLFMFQEDCGLHQGMQLSQ